MKGADLRLPSHAASVGPGSSAGPLPRRVGARWLWDGGDVDVCTHNALRAIRLLRGGLSNQIGTTRVVAGGTRLTQLRLGLLSGREVCGSGARPEYGA